MTEHATPIAARPRPFIPNSAAQPLPYAPVHGPVVPVPAPMPAPFVAQVPVSPLMPRQTYASAMSYVGITRRTTAWVRRVGSAPVPLALAVAAAAAFLAFMYVFVTMWYLVVGVIFGWLLFPFRLVRRSHRKQEALQKQQLATMQAMLVQQQQQQQQQQYQQQFRP